MSRRSGAIPDNISSYLFPETVGALARTAEIADPNLSASSSASSGDLGESPGNLPSVECDPATLGRVANSGHKDESWPEADPQEAIFQPRPDEHISGVDGAGELIYRASESDDAITASKNSEPHIISGSTPSPPAEPDRMTCAGTGFNPEFHSGLEEDAYDETASAGVQPRGITTVYVPSEDSHGLCSVAASAEAEQKVEASDADATAEGGQNDLALPDSGSDPAPLEDRGGAGREHGGADASDRQTQTAEGISEVEHLQQGGEPQQAEPCASVSKQCADAPIPAVNESKSKKARQSHPKVIDKERDSLGNSEEEILDRLVALSAEQHKVPQNYPRDEVEAGYKDLKTANATCAKTVQRNIPKLMKKGFIDRVKEGNEIRAGSRARYRINTENEVKKRRLEKGLTHFVEIGLARKAVPDPEQRTESGI